MLAIGHRARSGFACRIFCRIGVVNAGLPVLLLFESLLRQKFGGIEEMEVQQHFLVYMSKDKKV